MWTVLRLDSSSPPMLQCPPRQRAGVHSLVYYDGAVDDDVLDADGELLWVGVRLRAGMHGVDKQRSLIFFSYWKGSTPCVIITAPRW